MDVSERIDVPEEATKKKPPLISRKSLCLTSAHGGSTLTIHHGDENFDRELGRWYDNEESNILEQLVELKEKLYAATNEEFWCLCAEQMAELIGGQLSFIAKRILVDDQDTAVEMPPLGEAGSCLMAAAFYYNDGHGRTGNAKNLKYSAYGAPCGYMRHDKVLVVPEKVADLFPENPNELPFNADSYIGIPLFADGKCFAHFGVMWSVEGNRNRKLSWSTVEMFMHSLEDLILQRFLEGSRFISLESAPREPSRIIPHEAVTVAQSLQPYAKSLSHELRTPMQGVVGMLDIMYATVQEAAEGQSDPQVRAVFEHLKENIEVVQDSSRRAVEAADNVVHAYDMNMAIPESSASSLNNDDEEPFASYPEIMVSGSDLPIPRPHKRRREETDHSEEGPNKIQARSQTISYGKVPSDRLLQGLQEAEQLPESSSSPRPLLSASRGVTSSSMHSTADKTVPPGTRHTDLRKVLQYVVNEGLKVGGRPDSAIAQETHTGEIIEVHSHSASGQPLAKVIEWSVHSDVPPTVLVDEKDLAKLVSCVFLNAIKFTEQGKVELNAKLSPKGRYIVIKCTDTGPGIPTDFLPKLFRPFSQEDPSLTRQSEGLGLGLLVAKGLARKLGGDLFCIRAETEGPRHGTEFEMRIPVNAGEVITRPSSPVGTPTGTPTTVGRQRNSKSIDSDGRPSPTPMLNTNTTSRKSGAVATSDPTVAREDTPSPTREAQPLHPIHYSMPPAAQAGRSLGVVARKASTTPTLTGIDRDLAKKHPLSFLVAEDNKINRKLLVSMLKRFGYQTIHEAYDGAEAVRQMVRHPDTQVVLCDLWMPGMCFPFLSLPPTFPQTFPPNLPNLPFTRS